ncbi:facilitated trehalose transporter Tret1-2 homolog [Athalia rosae]|uniref:facilitated trehalose transporter Tret1-2 homolog n=1 Tax=Athalia rosae TaxID=37344 RepID=UPI00203492F6|nr:facilitated trehalose transporter Tret1-2 homolog [Athalia rosae]
MIVSEFVMGICLFGLGGFTMMRERDVHLGERIAWFPLLITSIYILAFCFGAGEPCPRYIVLLVSKFRVQERLSDPLCPAGPVPWTYMGEIFPPELKGVASSSAAFLNWLLAFVVTVPFSSMIAAIGGSATFWIFSVICFLNVAFCYFCMIETKGKTLEEILRELGVSRAAGAYPDFQNTGEDIPKRK